MASVPVAHSVKDLRARLAPWRAGGDSLALVPTMGALHDGHLSLVRLAKRRARRVVVSIFVNPAQFGPREDFGAYPRSLDGDRAALDAVDADLVFAPGVDTMYPPGFATTVSLAGPASVGLEDAFRPTHFAGVATVVVKLLIQNAPDIAVFGEKDYQQLKVVMQMARDLDLPTRIVAAETVREADGLAMSSRNRFLSSEARAKAPLLHATLLAAAGRLRLGTPLDAVLDEARSRLAQADFRVDYFEARHAETLALPSPAEVAPMRLLVAARLDQTRLIDNVAV